MARLINADTLKAVFEEKCSVAVCGAKLCKAIISRIDESPTVDAVPVIRCKDCKHRKRCIKTTIIKSALGGEIHMPLDLDGNGYCSAGERKEE